MVQDQNFQKFNEDFIKSIRFTVQINILVCNWTLNMQSKFVLLGKKIDFSPTHRGLDLARNWTCLQYMPNCKEVPNL